MSKGVNSLRQILIIITQFAVKELIFSSLFSQFLPSHVLLRTPFQTFVSDLQEEEPKRIHTKHELAIWGRIEKRTIVLK